MKKYRIDKTITQTLPIIGNITQVDQVVGKFVGTVAVRLM